MGGAIHGVRCSLRYETDTQFFTTTGQKEGHAILIIGTVYSLSIVCTRLFFCFLSIRRKQKRVKINSMEKTTNMDEVMRLWKIEDAGSEFSLYDFSQITDATDNFSDSNILGEGGFGPVYKGLFPDGQELAIKKLAAQSRQGLVEFKNEIQLVAKLQHKNLVRLLGCCVHEEQKILIYEYLPNKSLDHFIFGIRSSLNWKTRRKIIEGIAQGLLYLHKHSRLRIIHRDLKASNILLDSELNPKISDFGMARIFPSDASQAKASRLVGTFGYMAPEYASEGLLSIKSDVFSFGVLLLEIMSGTRSAGFQHYGEFQNLLEYAWGMWKDRRWCDFIDQSFGDEYEPGEMMKYLVVALMCVQEKSAERPTMSDVVAMLSSDDIPLTEPRQPAYSHIRVDVPVDVDVSCSRNDITITLTDVLFISCPAPSVGQELCSDYNGAIYMPNSTYKSNLISLAATLIANATELHSATGMAGTGLDKVYGAVSCRGDSDGSDCRKHLTEALDAAINSKNGNSYSPKAMNKKVAYYYNQDQAKIHFSNQDFISSFTNVPECTVNTNLNAVTASVAKQFEDLVTKVLRALTDAAVSRAERYAVGKQRFEETGQTLYGLVQCMQGMPPEQCMNCLDGIISGRQSKISTTQMGAAILGVWCTLRYETDTQFFTDTKMLLLDVLKKSEHTGKKAFFRRENTALVSIGGWIKTQQQREQALSKLRRLSSAIKTVIYIWRTEGTNSDFFLYDFSQIKEYTNNFSNDNKLGQGGFGPVYKGQLSSGLKIAVKRLETCSLQGLLEFQNEIQLIAKLQHKNLVKLLGCCTQGDQEKILVYEYLENKSLDYFIFNNVKGAQLNWSKRLHIIDGIGQGLLYLHSFSRLCVVHRDLKASNILLDSTMNPKISDFGMARIFYSNMAESNTTRIVGTHGYIPPEYAFEGVCSIKSDVFSFGVLILEIVSGKRTAHFYQHNGKLYNLISFAWQLWRDGKWGDLIYYPPGNKHQEIERCIHVALLCVQESAEFRPTMEQVVTMLNTKNVSLPMPMQPAYFNVNPSEEEVSSCNVTSKLEPSHLRSIETKKKNFVLTKRDTNQTVLKNALIQAMYHASQFHKLPAEKKKTPNMQMLLVSLLLLLFISSLNLLVAQHLPFCSNANTITHMPEGTYKTNLLNLAENLIANVTEKQLHSATGTAGAAGPDKVYGAVLCRGDSAVGSCASLLRRVLATASINGTSSDNSSYSQNHKSVTLYDHEFQALLSFSDKDFISSFSNAPECTVSAYLNPSPDADRVAQFSVLFSELMENIAAAVVSRPASYLTGRGWFDLSSQTVYALAQCMDGMPPERCRSCLDGIIDEGKKMVGDGLTGGAVLGVRCSLWYQTDIRFFAGDPDVSLHMPTPSKFWIWVVIGSFSLMIKEATQNFSRENKLGQGGFGTVYKGLLPGGLEVAVKRLSACSVQGLLEFKNEIQLIAKLQHKNLVKLLGCCIEGEHEKMLVYEYLQNRSLDRLHIIDGIAQGILYLHNHSRVCVVHRDLKASNILLDSDMTPKISDFGMARIFGSNMIESNTTRIVGTHGYISPEYAFDGVCSIKSDVFSFGVLVLEIISGKRTAGFYPYDGRLCNLISYAWQLWRSGQGHELVCCRIGNNHKVIERCIQVALLCVQERADDRPSIDQVVTMLNSEEMTLPKPNQPAYFYVRSSGSDDSSCNNSISITLASNTISPPPSVFG
uniref:non-specific serine/threonine protein kinase n=1 Tax=Oryza punctata TaxID=4537 RepID=A0A0E0LLM6_ORYPU